MNAIKVVLANNVRKLRKSRGWTQEMLADRAGLSNFAIQAVESGRSWPVHGTIQQIAMAFNVSTVRLFQAESIEHLSNDEALSYLARNLGYEIVKRLK